LKPILGKVKREGEIGDLRGRRLPMKHASDDRLLATRNDQAPVRRARGLPFRHDFPARDRPASFPYDTGGEDPQKRPRTGNSRTIKAREYAAAKCCR